MKSIQNFQYCFTVFVLFLVIVDSTSGQFYKKKKSKWRKFGRFAGGIAALGLGAFLGNKYQQNGGFGGFGGGGGSQYGGQYGGDDYGGGGGGYGGQGGGEYYKK